MKENSVDLSQTPQAKAEQQISREGERGNWVVVINGGVQYDELAKDEAHLIAKLIKKHNTVEWDKIENEYRAALTAGFAEIERQISAKNTLPDAVKSQNSSIL